MRRTCLGITLKTLLLGVIKVDHEDVAVVEVVQRQQDQVEVALLALVEVDVNNSFCIFLKWKPRLVKSLPFVRLRIVKDSWRRQAVAAVRLKVL